jgi:antitoxin (DNA-binding transcriptional repressor) of toxin-antitoxin stability system
VTEVISQRELRNDSGRIMRALDDGRTFIVTRHAEPVGELRPLRRRRLVPVAAVLDIFGSAPEIDAARLRKDLDETVDQTTTPRA